MTKNEIILLIVVFMLLIVGTADVEDTEQEQIAYCDNVRDGVWPDFKEIYATDCKEVLQFAKSEVH